MEPACWSTKLWLSSSKYDLVPLSSVNWFSCYPLRPIKLHTAVPTCHSIQHHHQNHHHVCFWTCSTARLVRLEPLTTNDRPGQQTWETSGAHLHQQRSGARCFTLALRTHTSFCQNSEQVATTSSILRSRLMRAEVARTCANVSCRALDIRGTYTSLKPGW